MQFLELSSNWPDEGYSMRVVDEKTVSRAFDLRDTGTMDDVKFYVIFVDPKKADEASLREVTVTPPNRFENYDERSNIFAYSDLVIVGTKIKVGTVHWTDH